MTRYRICKNQAPHQDDWWTVERETVGWFGRVKWKKVQAWAIWGTRVRNSDLIFLDYDSAQAWVTEAKRPVVHECGVAQ